MYVLHNWCTCPQRSKFRQSHNTGVGEWNVFVRSTIASWIFQNQITRIPGTPPHIAIDSPRSRNFQTVQQSRVTFRRHSVTRLWRTWVTWLVLNLILVLIAVGSCVTTKWEGLKKFPLNAFSCLHRSHYFAHPPKSSHNWHKTTIVCNFKNSADFDIVKVIRTTFQLA